MTKVRLQSAQDAARQIESEVAERLVALENEYKVKFGVLEAERESISTQQEERENLRRENSKLKEMSVQEECLLKDKLEQVGAMWKYTEIRKDGKLLLGAKGILPFTEGILL